MLFQKNTKFTNQEGTVMILAGVLVVLALGFFAYLAYNFFRSGNPKATLPSPSPSISTYQSKKLESYDKYKDDIKKRLNLSEEEFQALKRFSAQE